MSEPTIRPATSADAPRLAAIYAPFVEQTAISFEERAPTDVEMVGRVAKAQSRWQWLVAEVDGAVAGYAYGSEHRARAAYRWSVEVTVYVDAQHHGRGIGRALYRDLLADLSDKGFCTAFAGVTLPNDASVGLHTAMGFAPIGVFQCIGWKFGRWHDVAWFQRRLRDRPPIE